MSDNFEFPAVDGTRYFEILTEAHKKLQPDWYFEVGTFRGFSLQLADCNFVAVDPEFRLKGPLTTKNARQMLLFQQTSDDFFASQFLKRNDLQFDFAFLDGLHHFDVLLRDFINIERHMKPGSVIALHDCCPTSIEMTDRVQIKGNWTGDVWKTVAILKRFRPDLDIDVTTAQPTGLAFVRGLDPSSTVLADDYDRIVREYAVDTDLVQQLAHFYRNIELLPPEVAIAKLR